MPRTMPRRWAASRSRRGVYFRMILVGYFEGIASQRGIAWRCSDSRSLADASAFRSTNERPTIPACRAFTPACRWKFTRRCSRLSLKLAAEHQLLAGKTVAIDSTTLEAGAAMKSIVRRSHGRRLERPTCGLAAEAGFSEDPTDEELRRFDKNRKDKKVSNDEWMSPNDPESWITCMKDGTTHLAYKAEHVVDLDTDLVLAGHDLSGRSGRHRHVGRERGAAQLNVIEAESPANIKEVVADKGYHHAAETLTVVNETLGIRNALFPSRTARCCGIGASDRRQASRGDRQPSPQCAGQEQEAATAAERIDGADVCSCVRNGGA